MANIELDGANKKIKVDSGDLTLDVPGDIVLDADGADLVFADGGTNILKVTNSSSDVVFQPQVDAKDLKFNQYDGRTLLEVNDGGFVAIANGATGPGQLRLYEDTDNGTNYSAFQVGTQSGDITYTLPTADGSNGHALTTNGSGTLSWASAGTTYAGIDDQSSSNDDQLTITDTAIVINEDSDDLDFRVESNGNANMLFVSGGNDVVGIGAEGDLGVGLHVKTGDSGGDVHNDADELVIEQAGGHVGMTFLNSGDNKQTINFGDAGDNNVGQIEYNHDGNTMKLVTNTAVGVQIDSAGHVTKPLNPAFRIYQSTNTDYAQGHTMYNQNTTEVYDVNADIGTNGTFTAPVTGKYIISLSIYDTSAADGREYDMILTTSNRNYRWGQRQEYEADVTGIGGNMKLEGTLIVDMDANDTAYVTSGVNATFTNGNNSEHSYYSGILIG